mmetsp:Transcript_22082/g.32261  ORF Transcript_22082/g.32261 Transcript_22082/m.32261 type:complete len:198 (+) Transcript_22082:47-640(+)|eukprot:CAMPEP_0197247278 /NCGR_PEP_ID=MMETSP1429-20130617/27737_1 /TAXON_ID=49237 /ORGANISM="Chaetoceros  sp., Strain UNC1202" /LENGTH=197 /DNA_ID=CAMNT_0042708149 /DNA_START=47 /DNA_END=640 /DNA_ORIENTATION=+
MKSALTAILLALLSILSSTNAFSIGSSPIVGSSRMSTTVAPPREKTDTSRKTNRKTNDNKDDDADSIKRYNDAPLEYLEDEWSTRNPDDPFHILLLDTTFTQNERVTINYVAGSLNYVLGMPNDEAEELAKMSYVNGMSCLGTWEREECLRLGRQLQIRDLAVRVVPFVEGGARGWQAKSASDGGSSADLPFSSGFE